MTNGFYDTSSLKSKAKRKRFLIDAFLLSYNTRCETKYNTDNLTFSRRELNRKYTPQLVLDIGGTLDVIDRKKYYESHGVENFEDMAGEIVIHTKDWEFLYIFLTIENLDKLVQKYKLKLKEW